MKVAVNLHEGGEDEQIRAEKGVNLFELINEAGYNLTGYCGRQGTCGKCRIRIKPAPEPRESEQALFDAEELEQGFRLACLHELENEIEIFLEKEGEISVLTGTKKVSGKLNSGWVVKQVKLSAPDLDDQRSYLSRFLADTGCSNISDGVIQDLDRLESKKDPVRAVTCGQKLVELGSGLQQVLGVAVDIGTTTLVLYLYDLETGERLGVESRYNPQKEYGADVISRIQFGSKNIENRKKLKQVLLAGLNQAILALTDKIVQGPAAIYRVTFAGNTTMLHTLFGLDAIDIARSPFIPTFTEGLTVRPETIGLEINPRGEVVVLPSISSYVGADILAGLIATGVGQTPGHQLLVDIGTNGEVAFGNDQELYACSVAAGPSFEGSNISAGMAALPGAIEKFEIQADGFTYSTIAGEKARGICGSGLLDLVAGLLEVGVITPKGAFAQPAEMPVYWQDHFKPDQEVKELELISTEGVKIAFTQKDIRQLQLAKGAVRAGIEILLARSDFSLSSIEKVFLVGGFANYLDPLNAVKIGMIPAELQDKIEQAGNGSGAGAGLYLLDQELDQAGRELQSKTQYIELSSDMEFQQKFTEHLGFPVLAEK
ncbi:MAG: ASKHA domain-containing protein [Bacillota bacterium]